ncbi:MAG: toxin-antitoxin system HicB family antitoxin [Pirellulales bacterium]
MAKKPDPHDDALAVAKRIVGKAKNWIDAQNALYGPQGELTKRFDNVELRRSWSKSTQSESVRKLLADLEKKAGTPLAPSSKDKPSEFSGKFNVRIPATLHEALASEADREGVSLNQLVVAKLAVSLRDALKAG